MNEIDVLYTELLKSSGIIGRSANIYIDAPEETKKNYIMEIKNQLKYCKPEMILLFGSELVERLENFN